MSQKQTQRDMYAELGVQAVKSDVKGATKTLPKGVFPGAFCQFHPHPYDIRNRLVFGHMDGPGTMASVAYIAYCETGDPNYFMYPSIAAVVMNTDDAACAGMFGPFWMLNYIARNPHKIPGPEPLAGMIKGLQRQIHMLEMRGIEIIMLGGETADVGDLVGTYDMVVAMGMVDPVKPREVIDASRITPGSVLVGLASFGQCPWELGPNAGTRANGLTALRHGLLSPYYRKKYPETIAPGLDKRKAYRGKYRLEDPLPGGNGLTIGSALMAEVRTYVPYLDALFELLPKRYIEGIIQCSGGGLTKIGHFGREGNRYVMDDLFNLPPIFQLAQEIPGMDDQQMGKTFCNGIGMILVMKEEYVPVCMEQAKHLSIGAKVIGRVEKGRKVDAREVVLRGVLNADYVF